MFYILLKVGIGIIHWLMAIMIFGLIISGNYMVGLDANITTNKYDIYKIHKSFGVTIIFLLIIRLIIRKTTSIPPMSENFSKIEKILAYLAHGLLYLFMIAVALSGYIMSDAANYLIMCFGLEMPDFIEKDKGLSEVARSLHTISPYIMLCLISIHILAALKHLFFDVASKNVLKKMW